ncbi:hypothetical protein SDC9_27166 [bioreactor metagenome]|jgi:putative ATP-dependent endonuclease of OLD family|uniref:Uncharacterized protein n=1 Tax=bioreactor metagenome TaxID=1076179 RepID=A0A644UR29_9ZZZZ|nr:AAA family ATPase [Macellibacteroides fermentans]
MYLHELKIWNFRKYGIKGNDFATADSGVTVEFQDGVNVLIGENNSGKTTIVDAIRLVLKTQSQDFFQVEDKDFHQTESGYRTTELKIECTFKGFSHHDAAHFLEWIGFDNKEREGEQQEYILKVWLCAKRKNNSVIQYTRAGLDSDGTYLEGEARELLKVVYLKPLRDALAEMTHGSQSRLAQILKSHPIFISKNDETGIKEKHELEKKYKKLKDEVDDFFKDEKEDGSTITQTLKKFLEEFLLKSDKKDAVIQLTGTELTDILKQLDLVLEENKSGLGSLNLLFIAAELLLHQECKQGLKLTLIEELEAHLHPQYQLRLIDFIVKQKKEYGQFILTTHSTTLASQIKLNNLIICQGNNVFPMKEGYTGLDPSDYRFLERFLDTTKANLFFARGIILVEGESENLLIPTIAKLINRPLNEYGVSIVNVGNKAYRRYAKIYIRKGEPQFSIKVSIISDMDIPVLESYIGLKDAPEILKINNKVIDELRTIVGECVDLNYIPEYFTSKASFLDFINANKKVKPFPQSKPSISKMLNIYYEKRYKESLTDEILKNLREEKELELKKEWINYTNINLFLAKNWTLEYEIAKSKLYKELIKAFRIAKFEKYNPERALDIEIYGSFSNEINKDYAEDNLSSQDTYDIFSPINNGLVSKVAVAQHLSELLLMENNQDRIVEILNNDPNLKYIVDAICHVTEPLTN